MAENVVTRYDPHFHLRMRVMTLIWCFRGWQVCTHPLINNYCSYTRTEKVAPSIQVQNTLLCSYNNYHIISKNYLLFSLFLSLYIFIPLTITLKSYSL